MPPIDCDWRDVAAFEAARGDTLDVLALHQKGASREPQPDQHV